MTIAGLSPNVSAICFGDGVGLQACYDGAPPINVSEVRLEPLLVAVLVVVAHPPCALFVRAGFGFGSAMPNWRA